MSKAGMLVCRIDAQKILLALDEMENRAVTREDGMVTAYGLGVRDTIARIRSTVNSESSTEVRGGMVASMLRDAAVCELEASIKETLEMSDRYSQRLMDAVCKISGESKCLRGMLQMIESYKEGTNDGENKG